MTNNNVYLKLNIDSFNILRQDKINITSGTRNYVFLEFSFSEDWENLDKKVVFSKRRLEAEHVAMIDNVCQIPNIFMDEVGDILVSVFGGNKRTSNSVRISVIQSGFVPEGEPQLPPQQQHIYVQSPTDGSVSRIRYIDEFQINVNGEWINIKNDNTILSDGSVSFIDEYIPTLEQDSATKKYVDDSIDIIGNQIVEVEENINIIDNKVVNLENIIMNLKVDTTLQNRLEGIL